MQLLNKDDHLRLKDNFDQIGKILTTMMNQSEKWCNVKKVK